MRSIEDPRILRWVDLLDRGKTFLFSRSQGRGEADENLVRFYEAVWRDAAEAVGATIVPLGQGVFEIRRGESWTRVLNNSTAMDHLATHCIVRSKAVVYRLLRENGLPVPRHLEFSRMNCHPALGFLEGIDGACVVKPASDSGGGQGVTTGVRTRWQLLRAAWVAGRGGRDVLVEEQIEGDNYRLLYLNGRLIDAVRRHPPSVVADGQSSVETLILSQNELRSTRGSRVSHGIISFDQDLTRTLELQGLSLWSIPTEGTVVRLKTAINENGVDENETVTDLIGKDLIRQGAEAASIAGVRLAGVDVITRDPRVSLHQSGGVILEVNSPPGYFWHYRKRDGAFPVAVHVLHEILGRDERSGLLNVG